MVSQCSLLEINKILNYIVLQKAINKPNFKHRTIFSKQLAAVHNYKTKVLFNKPIYIGQAVLDLSKVLMYNFHYDVIKNEFNENVKLLYGDTDSFIYEIKNADFYEFMKNNPPDYLSKRSSIIF